MLTPHPDTIDTPKFKILENTLEKLIRWCLKDGCSEQAMTMRLSGNADEPRHQRTSEIRQRGSWRSDGADPCRYNSSVVITLRTLYIYRDYEHS